MLLLAGPPVGYQWMGQEVSLLYSNLLCSALLCSIQCFTTLCYYNYSLFLIRKVCYYVFDQNVFTCFSESRNITITSNLSYVLFDPYFESSVTPSCTLSNTLLHTLTHSPGALMRRQLIRAESS
jgi:hypothetical protein